MIHNINRKPLLLSLKPKAMTFHYTLSLVLFLLILLAEHGTEAGEYSVGDADGWINGNNYLTWSQKYNFSVGDVLVFKYVKGQHNVYQVSEDTYRSCDASSGIKAIYENGNDRVTLTEATEYWFICNTKGHCKGGMRFGITVGRSEAGTLLPPLPATGDDNRPPPSSNAAAGGYWSRRSWMWGLWLLVVS